MITPVHFLIQYPITTTIIPPNRKYIINSDDPTIEEKEKFLAIIIPYSTILVISLFEKNTAARILPI
jgi:hypothetical protein